MKIFKKCFAFVLMLCVILQPLDIGAAYEDSEGNVCLQSGNYKTVELERVPHGDSSSWMKSGNYFYEFLDRSHRYITIRKVEQEALKDGKLSIPYQLDGYIVLGVSVFWDEDYSKLDVERCGVLDEPKTLKELILPDSIEYLGFASFYKCFGLKKISFSKKNHLVSIEPYALAGCISLKKVKFPPGVYISSLALGHRNGPKDTIFDIHLKKVIQYSDSLVYYNEWFSEEDETELYIKKHNRNNFVLEMPGNLNKLYIDNELSIFHLKIKYDETWDDSDPPICNYKIKKLIINGKGTELWLPEEINEVFPAGGLKGVYTVKDAACIKEAKKYRIPIYWKTAGKTKKVKAKKVKEKYKANWIKINTSICKYWYSLSKGKWTTKKTPVKTIYKVYGKKGKKGKYKFLQTTKKKSIKSKYKYIKAVPVKEWD